MQTVAVTETKKAKGCSAKTPKVVKVKKVETEAKEPIIFGDLDDIIRVARDKVHELCYALPSELRTLMSEIESDIEVLELKVRAPVGFGLVKETPPILSTIEKLEEKLRVVQGPEITEAKKKVKYLMDEKDFVLQKNKK